jgi:nitrogen regulatory protein PII
MKFKLIMALVQDEITEDVIKAAREAGATGCTVITSVRGEGLVPPKTFLGLDLTGLRDMVLFLVEGHLSRDILETIAEAGKFRDKPGSGIAFQMDIEDAVGLESQLQTIRSEIEEEL